MKTAVLMTCYNRVETTLRCLRGLYAQYMPCGMELDVYLVDDASPDKTGARVREEYPNVNVIIGTGGLFWCKGMRLAWDMAVKSGVDYDYYLWLNDDVQLANDALKGIYADYEDIVKSGSKDGIVIGTFQMSSEDDMLTYGVFDSAFKIVRPNGKPRLIEGDSMSGNMVLVPKSIYKAVGEIYDGYHHGGGDNDYRQMVQKAGFGAYAPSRVTGICFKDPARFAREPSIVKRFNSLFSPKGLPIHDIFLYRYRHWGVWAALASTAYISVRTVLGLTRSPFANHQQPKPIA